MEYTVDENGFHPSLINYDDVLRQPTDSEAVKRAKERHHILYEKIAARNSQGASANLPKVYRYIGILYGKVKYFLCNQFRRIRPLL